MAITPMGDGKWRVQAYDPATKSMRHIGVYDDEKAAIRAERDAIARQSARGETVGSFGRRWTTDYPRPKASTNRHNAERVSRFVKRYDKKRIEEVDRTITAAWARVRPGDVSALRAMWGDAIREGRADYNPWSNMRISKGRGRADLQPGWFTANDLDRLEQCALDSNETWGIVAAALIICCADAGTRAGEAFALDWPAIDLDRLEITVRVQLDSHDRQMTLPKNGRVRIVAMSDRLADRLAVIRHVHPTIVFPSPTGRRLYAPSWAYHWKAIRTAFGRPGMELHELRHYCATQLLAGGLQPWQVAMQLGHTDGGALITQVYGHPDDGVVRGQVRDTLNRDAAPAPEADADMRGTPTPDQPAKRRFRVIEGGGGQAA